MLLRSQTTNLAEATMNRSTAAALAASLAVAGTVTGIGVASASGAATTHTMQFVGSQIKDVMANDKDVATDKNTQNGKTVGYDVTSCAINITTHVATCTVAVARAQGILVGKAKVNVDTGKGSGTVTGGTGGFHGATGTMTINPGSSQNSNKITITYQV